MTEQLWNMRGHRLMLVDNDSRLPLVDFIRLAKTYITSMCIDQVRLRRVYNVLDEYRKMDSCQFDEAIDFVRMMNISLEDFYEFMDQRLLLPLAILPIRSQLITGLLYLKEQLWMLLALLGKLRASHRSNSIETVPLQNELIGKLNSLLKDSEHFVQLSLQKFDLARFQERQDHAAITAPHEECFRSKITSYMPHNSVYAFDDDACISSIDTV